MEKQIYIQDSIERLFAIWLRRTSAFGALIFLLLSLLDFIVFRAPFERFLGYRIAMALFLLLVAAVSGKAERRASLAAITAAAVVIEVTILYTGGHASPYATGMVLLAVSVLAFVPADLSFHAAAAAIIYASYLIPVILIGQTDNIHTFFMTNIFICTVILTVLILRYLSMQGVRKQLGDEFELIAAGDYRATIAALTKEIESRIDAQETLGRNRLLLHGIFNSIQDGIILLDTDMNVIMANNAAESMLRKKLSTGFKTFKCFEVIRQTAERCEDCRAVSAIRENRPEVETVPYRPYGTGAGWLEIHTFPFYDEKGEARGVIKYLRDITERTTAAEAVKESEERFKKLLDNAPIAISMINADGTVEYVNRKHAEILGYDLADIPTLEHWWALAYPDDKDRTIIKSAWQTISKRALLGEKVSAVDRWIVCKDNTTRELELNFSTAAGRIIVSFGDITGRKRAEEKLQESEKRFRTLFEKASEGIFLLSMKPGVITVNEAYARMHGYSVQEILNFSLWDLDVGLDPETYTGRLNRVAEEGSIVFEVEHRHKAGHVLSLEVSMTSIELNNEKFFLCFHHDISARKQAEKELREKEANMRAMLKSFDGLIYICSPDYRIEFMNEHLVLRTERNAVGEHCYAVLNERDSVCPWCVNERVFRGEIIRYEIQSPKDDRWYHVVNTPIRHDDGSVSKLAMFLDVTQRKNADIALKESEERYKRLIVSVTDYIYTVTIEDGRQISTNHGEGCYAVTGYSSEQYQADPDLWYRMVYDVDRDSVVEQVQKMLAGERSEPLEHRIVHSSGSIRWVMNTLVPLFDKFGQLIAYDGLISDITERKMLEEELEKVRMMEQENLKIFSRRLLEVQEEERRAIARELHDEIGQSLTGLKLSVESIANSLRSDQADNLRAIEVSLGELLSIVRHMSLNLRPAMLDDFGLVNTLLWYFERYKSQTGISVFFIQSGADRRFGQQKEIALYRITQESLTNVARHAGVKSVMVKLDIEQDRVILMIKDEGRGFDASHTAHSCSGLSIMRERSILLNGTFSLSSSLNKGTEVTVAMPLYTRESGQEGWS